MSVCLSVCLPVDFEHWRMGTAPISFDGSHPSTLKQPKHILGAHFSPFLLQNINKYYNNLIFTLQNNTTFSFNTENTVLQLNLNKGVIL